MNQLIYCSLVQLNLIQPMQITLVQQNELMLMLIESLSLVWKSFPRLISVHLKSYFLSVSLAAVESS